MRCVECGQICDHEIPSWCACGAPLAATYEPRDTGMPPVTQDAAGTVATIPAHPDHERASPVAWIRQLVAQSLRGPRDGEAEHLPLGA